MNVKRALLITAILSATAQADIIFSEYIEGSSNNKALELLNTSSQTVSLEGYRIELYSNGATSTTNALNLSGSLNAGDVFVIANANAVDSILSIADIASSVTNFNGDDAILLKKDGVVVDRIGQLGVRVNFGKDVTLVRNNDITQGDSNATGPFDTALEWQSYSQDTFDYLGSAGTTDPVDPPPPPPSDLTCAEPATLLSSIQGESDVSPFDGQTVTIEAVVVGDFQADNQMRGFFVQEEDRDQDNNPLTSEGLFVFHNGTEVNIGDQVRVRGEVDEFFNLTQLTNVTDLVVCASNTTLPTTSIISLPLSATDDLEAVESMRVEVANRLTVNEVYQLGRFGEFTVAEGRRFIPTQVAMPGAEADAVRAMNNLNKLIVDDGIRTQNPDPVIFPAPGLSAYNTLRIGDTLDNLTGVINFSFGEYKLVPTVAPAFNGDNARTIEPDTVPDSDLRIAAFNVLNYFNGDGQGGEFPTPRGARTVEELERQSAKIVSALVAIDADIIGLMEIENDGFGTDSAIAELTRRVNAELSADDHYQYVAPSLPQLGDDAIAVGLMYRPSRVSMAGNTALLNSANSIVDAYGDPLFDDSRNRPVLTQSFQAVDSGEYVTVAVNHFKSKGASNCDTINDCDEGQGAYNVTRTNAANALAEWLNTQPTGIETDNVVVLGDLNAYRMEDPIRALEDAGFQSLKEAEQYTYVFDGETGSLDHILATPSLANKLLKAQVWNINTDEPLSLDYSLRFKSPTQQIDYYAPTPYRSSDHDPVIVDFKFNAAPEVSFQAYPFLFWFIFVDTSIDRDGYVATQTWTINGLNIKSPLMFVPRWYVYRNRIDEVTLTVTDDSGATATDTRRFR